MDVNDIYLYSAQMVNLLLRNCIEAAPWPSFSTVDMEKTLADNIFFPIEIQAFSRYSAP